MKIEFISSLALQFDLFQQHMMASLKWNDNYAKNMRRFDRYCHEKYPGVTVLTWDITMGWCRKRETEIDRSCVTRIQVVCRLCDFLNQRGLAAIPKLDIPEGKAPKYIPHFFTDEELTNLFRACDEITPRYDCPCLNAHKIMVPTYFRLLYSTGARTRELLMLKRKDVDLAQSVISINLGKGHKSRYVCIHDAMLPILEQYDRAMDRIYPDRCYFFPSGAEGHLSSGWPTWNFKKMWYKYNDAKAVAYDLRHHYAITNINAMVNGGFDTFDALMYLSKSMGHSSVEVTRYYYEIVPALADTLEQVSGESTDQILPDLDDSEW